jgi:hypothetical protein
MGRIEAMGAIQDEIERRENEREMREERARISARASGAIRALKEAQRELRGNGCYSPPRFFDRISSDIEVAIALLIPQVES